MVFSGKARIRTTLIDMNESRSSSLMIDDLPYENDHILHAETNPALEP
jgi:hypothetical protein